jgi:hypothetical protein
MTHIIYRTCENIHAINGLRPEWCVAKTLKNKCLKSLASGLKDQDYQFIVIGDKLKQESINIIKSIIPDADIRNFEEGLGNQKSLFQSYCAADSLINDKDVVFFCEDDYLFLSKWLKNMEHFFANIGNKFEYSFYHPTDYPDQYREDRTRRGYLFLNPNGGWFREVDSTTCTKACSVKTYKKHSELMKDCAIRKKIGYNQQAEPVYNDTGADDGRLSEIFGHKNSAGYIKLNQTAVCFSPIPGDSSHIHKGTESNFIDWGQLYKSIDE